MDEIVMAPSGTYDQVYKFVVHHRWHLKHTKLDAHEVVNILLRLKEVCMTPKLLEETKVAPVVKTFLTCKGQASVLAKELIDDWHKRYRENSHSTNRSHVPSSHHSNDRHARAPPVASPADAPKAIGIKKPSSEDTSGNHRKIKVDVQILKERPSTPQLSPEELFSNSPEFEELPSDSPVFGIPSSSKEKRPRSPEHRVNGERKHGSGEKARKVEVMSSKNSSSKHVSKSSNAKVGASSTKSSADISKPRESASASTPKASSKKSSSSSSSSSSRHSESASASLKKVSGSSKSKDANSLQNGKPSKRPRDSSASSESSPRKKIKKLSDKAAEKGFDATVASFDEVLGILDCTTTSVKKKKPSPPVAKKQKSSVAENLKSAPCSSSSRISEKTSSKSRSSPVINLNVPSPPQVLNVPAHRDASISIALPEIQPNYKPIRYSMPEVPMMRSRVPNAEVNEGSFTSSRHNRTQVFSGRRQGLTEVPRLFDSCLKTLQENVDSMTYTGGIPYDILEPVFKKCSPEQLYNIEYYNEYLVDDTGPLWENICDRVFKGAKPGEYESWRDLYMRLVDEREARLKRITANISASAAKTLPVRKTKLAYVDVPVKPPRNVFRQQVKNGTATETNRNTISNKSAPNLKQRLARPPPGSESISAPPAAANSGATASSHQKPAVKKVAPLMKKTLQLMKSNFRR